MRRDYGLTRRNLYASDVIEGICVRCRKVEARKNRTTCMKCGLKEAKWSSLRYERKKWKPEL